MILLQRGLERNRFAVVDDLSEVAAIEEKALVVFDGMASEKSNALKLENLLIVCLQ